MRLEPLEITDMTSTPSITVASPGRVQKIVVAEDFSRTPGGRFIKTGPHSGELFRERVLAPLLTRHEVDEVVVDLDGVDTYIGSFLEEAFGGLLRMGTLTYEDVAGRLRIVASGEFEVYRDLALKYIRDEARRHKAH